MSSNDEKLAREARLDKRIAESKFARGLAIVSRLGGVACVGLVGYCSAKSGSSNQLAWAIPGIAAIAGGVQMGLERGSAIMRKGQRDNLGGNIYVGVSEERKHANSLFNMMGVRAGPVLATAGAVASGYALRVMPEPEAQLPPIFTGGFVGITVLGMAVTEACIDSAGQHSETKPRIYEKLLWLADVLHLSKNN